MTSLKLAAQHLLQLPRPYPSHILALLLTVPHLRPALSPADVAPLADLGTAVYGNCAESSCTNNENGEKSGGKD